MREEALQNGAANQGISPYASLQPYQTERSDGKQQLERMLDLLYRRRWLVIGTFLIVSAVAVVYALTRPPEYQSSAIVMVNMSRSSNSAPSAAGLDPGGNVFARNDRTLSGELFLIRSSYTINQRVNQRLREAVESQDSTAQQELSYPPRGNVDFSAATRDANALRVTGISTDPYEAALLANLYAEEYVRMTQDASRTYMAQSREFLQEQQETRRQELNEAEERLSQYRQQTGLVGLDASGSSLVNQLSGMEAQRDNAMIELQMREASLERVQNELNTISPRLAERLSSGVDQRIAAINDRRAELEVAKQAIQLNYPDLTEEELEEVNTDYANANRRLRQLRAELEPLADAYVDEVSAAGGISSGEQGLSVVNDLRNQAVSLQIEISGLRSQIDRMNERIGGYEGELSTIPERSLQLARLERDRQHSAQMYEILIQRLQQARIEEESEPGYAHIIREAGVPGAPAGPDVPRYIIYGLLLGAMLGIGLAIGRDKLDNRFYKPDQLKKGKYPLLSVIPNMKPLIREDHGGKAFVEENGHRYSTGLSTLLNPISTVSEAYRQLRTNLQFSRLDSPTQVIVVTSAGIGEGKSTTAANLAIIMAQAGRRTLLVDCDLRRPQVHRLLGRDCYPGLVQVLFDDPRYSIDDARSEIDNLYIMTSGEVRPAEADGASNGRSSSREYDDGMVVANPAELLGSQRMQSLIAELRKEFDTIILDTPPVLAATDAALVSTYADATVLVVRAGQSREGEFEHAIDSLRRVDAPIVGTVMNGFDVSMAYGYKYRYRTYTKYGQYSKYGYYGYRNGQSAKERKEWVKALPKASV